MAFAELERDAYSDAPDSLTESWFLGGTYAYAVTMDGLAYLINVDETYYYRVYGTNQYGDRWATSSSVLPR